MNFAVDTLALINHTFGSTDSFLLEFNRIYKESKCKEDIIEISIDGRAFTFLMTGGFNTVAVKAKDMNGIWVKIFEFNDH